MLLGTLAASILGNMLAGKPTITGQWVIRAGEGTIRANEETNKSKSGIFNAASSFNNSEIQKYYLKYKNIKTNLI